MLVLTCRKVGEGPNPTALRSTALPEAEDRTPVAAFRLRPGGTVPRATLKVGAGLPVARKV